MCEVSLRKAKHELLNGTGQFLIRVFLAAVQEVTELARFVP